MVRNPHIVLWLKEGSLNTLNPPLGSATELLGAFLRPNIDSRTKTSVRYGYR